MKNLALEIENTLVPDGSAALWWLAQAGFAFKCSDETVIYLDPYLSDAVEALFGFKRLSLAPICAEEVRADWVISSHEHLDHLDADALPVIARNNPGCLFAGPEPCRAVYESCGIDESRQVMMAPGGAYDLGGARAYAARADHGKLSPSALALVLDFGEVRVMFSGDTALRLEWLQPLIDLQPDVLIACINGAFGNLDAGEAARLAAVVKPRLVIPCHFWMFKEHGGDPESFVQACGEQCPRVQVRLLSPGEGVLVTQESAVRIGQ